MVHRLLAAIQTVLTGASQLPLQLRVESPLDLGPTTEPEPDLAQVVRREDGYWSAHPKAADTALVIEVSDSSLVFDLETKARLYAGAGIPHGRVIDGQQPCLHGVRQEAADPHARFVAELRGVAEQLVASLPPP